MPLYEYQCPCCEHKMEMAMPMHVKVQVMCPDCLVGGRGMVDMSRILSPVAGIVKNPAVPKRTKK